MSFQYIINDKVITNIPWERPSQHKLNLLIKNYCTYKNSDKTNIYLYGKFNSNFSHKTWDIDLIMTPLDNASLSIFEIRNLLWGLIELSVQLDILIDVKFIDDISKCRNIYKDHYCLCNSTILNLDRYPKIYIDILTPYCTVVKIHNSKTINYTNTHYKKTKLCNDLYIRKSLQYPVMKIINNMRDGVIYYDLKKLT